MLSLVAGKATGKEQEKEEMSEKVESDAGQEGNPEERDKTLQEQRRQRGTFGGERQWEQGQDRG